MIQTDLVESSRLQLEERLKSEKSLLERNKMGQFPTPTRLASDILDFARSLLPNNYKVRFFDPAFGTGAFYSALLRAIPKQRIAEAHAYEIDKGWGHAVMDFWEGKHLDLTIDDFTSAIPPSSEEAKPNLIICNPPYTRHHHISKPEKQRLRRVSEQITGLKLSGLSGLYCYFLFISHQWMSKSCLAGWLIPSEFMDVNYGKVVKEYLLNQVSLLRIHRFDPEDVQFEDALVSSAVVWFKNTKPSIRSSVLFTYGGSLAKPKVCKSITRSKLDQAPKWTVFPTSLDSETPITEPTLSDFFIIKRGLATGANSFFILTAQKASEHRIPAKFLLPILPSPRKLESDTIEADVNGNPKVREKLFLLNCDLSEKEVSSKYPSLWTYLVYGANSGINERYLCKHRNPWYIQERRPASLFLCTYMGRKSNKNDRPFRFIWNQSEATAANVYLMLYPKPSLESVLKQHPALAKKILEILNNVPSNKLISEGRVYGGGLHKLEPRELAHIPVTAISKIVKNAK